ncbi:DUF494 family protein [Escherichia coli]
MYLFETYIHTEAELRVDQDKLEQDLTDAGVRLRRACHVRRTNVFV